MTNIYDENEPVIPNFNVERNYENSEDWAIKRLEEIKTEVKYDQMTENILTELDVIKALEEDYPKVVSNSVGTSKSKKIFIKIFLPLAICATLGIVGKGVHTNHVIEEAKQTYIEDIKEFETGRLSSSGPEIWLDFEDIGNVLAKNMIDIYKEDADLSSEIIIALGLTIDEVDEEYFDYNIKNSIVPNITGNTPWAEKIYNEIRSELLKNEIITLPDTLIDFLSGTKFSKTNMKFNPITGELIISEDYPVTEKEMIENLVAYAKYLSYQKALNKGGPARG